MILRLRVSLLISPCSLGDDAVFQYSSLLSVIPCSRVKLTSTKNCVRANSCSETATTGSTREERVHHYLYLYLFIQLNYLYPYPYTDLKWKWAGLKPRNCYFKPDMDDQKLLHLRFIRVFGSTIRSTAGICFWNEQWDCRKVLYGCYKNTTTGIYMERYHPNIDQDMKIAFWLPLCSSSLSFPLICFYWICATSNLLAILAPLS